MIWNFSFLICSRKISWNHRILSNELKLPFFFCAKNFVKSRQRMLLNLSLFFVVLQKFRKIIEFFQTNSSFHFFCSAKNFVKSHHITSIVVKETLLNKNSVKSKNALNILFTSAKNVKYLDSCNFAAKRLWKYKCHVVVVCMKLDIVVSTLLI